MDPDPALPDSVMMVLASFETPMNLPLARELWNESASDSLAKVRIPTLVLIGGNDLQIDMHADGDPLQQAAAGMANVTFAFRPTRTVFSRQTTAHAPRSRHHQATATTLRVRISTRRA
jgi:uncharacterized protein